MDPIYVVVGVLFLIEAFNFYSRRASRKLVAQEDNTNRRCPKCGSNKIRTRQIYEGSFRPMELLICTQCRFRGEASLFNEKTVL